jgi:hypothetical protein
MNTRRWLAVAVALSTLVAGPLAPSMALAQTPPPPPPSMQPPPPPPPPTPPTMIQSSPPPQSMQPPPPYGPAVAPPYVPTTGAKVGTTVLNVIYVPGKAIVCGAGTLAGTAMMLLTFGSGYRAAASIFNEGCGGHWVLTPYDVAGRTEADERGY